MLSVMNTLVEGDTWYGKYGFRPYDPLTNTENIQKTQLYNRNKTIVTTTLVRDTNLFQHLFAAINNASPIHIPDNAKFIKNLFNKYQDCTISHFFKHFVLHYKNACELLSLVYIDYYTDQKLYSFHGESFYLDL